MGQKIMAYGPQRLSHMCFYCEVGNFKLCSNIFVAQSFHFRHVKNLFLL